tara:strand:+ start:162 stop:350 length:189 start_codon:yes stop_codon:yes gene_type:complete
MIDSLPKEKKMSTELTKGTFVTNPDTEDKGYLLGPFWRKGEKWWTINWEKAGTQPHREDDIK